MLHDTAQLAKQVAIVYGQCHIQSNPNRNSKGRIVLFQNKYAKNSLLNIKYDKDFNFYCLILPV